MKKKLSEIISIDDTIERVVKAIERKEKKAEQLACTIKQTQYDEDSSDMELYTKIKSRILELKEDLKCFNEVKELFESYPDNYYLFFQPYHCEIMCKEIQKQIRDKTKKLGRLKKFIIYPPELKIALGKKVSPRQQKKYDHANKKAYPIDDSVKELQAILLRITEYSNLAFS